MEDFILRVSKRSDCFGGGVDRVIKIKGDASSRQYFRVISQQGSFIVAKDASENKEVTASNFIKIRDIFSSAGVKVPHVIYNEVKDGLIVQEDFGNDVFLSRLYESDTERLRLYRKAIEELVKIHSVEIENPWPSFDVEKLMYEVNFCLEHFIKGHLGNTDFDESMFIKEWTKICQYLASREMVLSHRDYHSRNLMCLPSGDVGVIDFQDARLGMRQYDLCSLLDDCYFSLKEESKTQLIDYYLGLCNKNFSKESFLKDYDMMAIQRLFKAIGSFSYLYMKKSNPLYLKHIGFAFEKMRALMDKFPELNILKKITCEAYYAH